MSLPISDKDIRFLGLVKKSFDVQGIANTAFTQELDDIVPVNHFRLCLRVGAAVTISGAAATGTVYIIPYNTKITSECGAYWLGRTYAAQPQGVVMYALPNLGAGATPSAEQQQTPFFLDEHEVLRMHSDAMGVGSIIKMNVDYRYLEFERLG